MLDVVDLNIEFHDHIIPETVVYDFDLHMDEGEIVGLVGESGSGKTMSALSIAGLLSRKHMKKRGKIEFDGVDILNCPRSELRKIQGKEISMVFQEPMTSLDPLKKIGYQVEESLVLHTEFSREERREKVLAALKDVELPQPEQLIDCYPHQLSGGMRQRVMIAAAVICRPRLLICDEPTTALDVTIQTQILDLLRKINRRDNTAILFISHDLSLVRQLCKRVIVMYQGNIVESGDTEKIFTDPSHEYTRRLIDAVPRFEKLKHTLSPRDRATGKREELRKAEAAADSETG